MTRRDLRTAAVLTLVLVGAGVVSGVLWWWVAPQAMYRVAEEGLYFVDPLSQAYIAADGWFAIVTAVVGAGAGAWAWFRFRDSGWGALLGLTVGGLVGAATAAGVGMLLGRADPWSQPVGSITTGALELRAWAVLLVEAGVAVAAWLLLELLVLRPDEPTEVPPEAADGPTDYGAVRDL